MDVNQNVEKKNFLILRKSFHFLLSSENSNLGIGITGRTGDGCAFMIMWQCWRFSWSSLDSGKGRQAQVKGDHDWQIIRVGLGWKSETDGKCNFHQLSSLVSQTNLVDEQNINY